MTEWIQQVDDHTIHDTLQGLETAIVAAEAKSNDSEQALLALARLQHVVKFCNRTLASVDPLLLAPSMLDGLEELLRRIIVDVNEFVTGASIDKLMRANAMSDKLISRLASLVVLESPQSVDDARSTIESFGKSTQALIHELRAGTDESKATIKTLETEVSKLQKTIENERGRIDQAVSQHQQQFSDAQSAMQSTFSEAEKQRTDKSSTDVSNWSQKFSAIDAKQNDVFKTFLASVGTQMDAEKISTEQSVSNLLKEIEDQRDQAKTIVGIIAGSGMAGGYKIDADAHRASYKNWNRLTVIGFIGMIGFAIGLYFSPSAEGNLGWPHTLTRIIVIVAFGLFAAYSGRMAMKHRESELQHRHKQLSFESVNSFVENLHPDAQKEIKQKMANVFFTQPHGSSETDDNVAPTTIDGLFKLLNLAINKLK